MTRMLQEQGYSVRVAVNGREALSMAQEQGSAIHLLITDLVMPEMGGTELAERLQSLFATIKVIFVSGHADNVAVQAAISKPGIQFMQKPFSMHELANKIREVLDAH